MHKSAVEVVTDRAVEVVEAVACFEGACFDGACFDHVAPAISIKHDESERVTSVEFERPDRNSRRCKHNEFTDKR